MNIIPYKRIDDLNFDDNYVTIKGKLDNRFKEDILTVIDKKYPRLYIEENDLMINFSEDYNSIRFFEFFNPSTKLTYRDLNLFNTTYKCIEQKVKTFDGNIKITDSGFISKDLGFSIMRSLKENYYTNVIESIIVFDKEYYLEPEIDLDELYKAIMGDDYDSDSEVSKWE